MCDKHCSRRRVLSINGTVGGAPPRSVDGKSQVCDTGCGSRWQKIQWAPRDVLKAG